MLAPAQLSRVPPQLVLQRQRLGILLGLRESGLPDIDDRVPVPVSSRNLPAARSGQPLTHGRSLPHPARPLRPTRSSPPAVPAPAAGPALAASPSRPLCPAHPDPGQAGSKELSSMHARVHLSRSRGAIRDEVNLLLFSRHTRAIRPRARMTAGCLQRHLARTDRVVEPCAHPQRPRVSRVIQHGQSLSGAHPQPPFRQLAHLVCPHSPRQARLFQLGYRSPQVQPSTAQLASAG
jgi:hypothetical protein